MAKYAHDYIRPDKNSNLDKKDQVAEMFNSIAFSYDFLNHFLSAGIDKRWRKKAILQLKELNPKLILDVATGTADVAIEACKTLKPVKIIGIDISENMLKIGQQKVSNLALEQAIELHTGDAETITYSANMFDAVIVSFGVRNFQNLEKGLAEMNRVLKPGGKLVVLEFTKPKEKGFKSLYYLYINIVAPLFGKLFAKNKSAYTYLSKSIKAFPEREQFTAILHNLGYKETYYKTLSLGICCIYCGSK